MPYIPDDEEQQNKDQNQAVQISGASPTTDSTGSAAPANGSKKELNTGSGYQNLDKYLQANSSQNFGGQVVDKVQGDVNKAQNNINDASTSFSNKVNSANYVPTSDQINSAVANPTSANPADYQKWESQTYSGPKTVTGDDYNNLWSNTNNASTKAGYLSSDPGRYTLLDSYYGTPSYNQGQKGLDNLLIQNQQGIGSQISNVQDQANQLKGTAQAQQDSLQNQASTKAAEVQNSAQAARNAVGVDSSGNVITDPNAVGYGAIGKGYTGVNTAVTDANSARANQVNQLKKDLASGNLSAEELGMTGLTAGQQLYNLPDLTSYVQAGSDLTKDQVMTPEQRANIQALSQLAGVTDTFAANPSIAQNSAYTFNTGSFKGDVSNAQNNYQSALVSTPITIPALWTNGGRGEPIALGDLEARVKSTQNGLNSGQKIVGGQQFLDAVLPIIAKAKQDISDKYQTNRTLNPATNTRPSWRIPVS